MKTLNKPNGLKTSKRYIINRNDDEWETITIEMTEVKKRAVFEAIIESISVGFFVAMVVGLFGSTIFGWLSINYIEFLLPIASTAINAVFSLNRTRGMNK
jgi:hypothetical protein